MRRWEVGRALELIQQERITTVSGAPTMLWDLVNAPGRARYDLSSLVSLAGGGQATPQNLLRAMAGHDPKDSTSVDVAVPDYEAALTGNIKGLRVGIPKEYRVDGMSAEIDRLWQQGMEWLKQAGAEPVEISLPHTKYALPTYYIIAPAEASSNLARYDGARFGLRVPGDSLIDMYENTRAEGFGKEVRRRVMIGTYVLSAGYYDAYYLRAQRVRRLIAGDFAAAFGQVDLIAGPTAPTTAFALGEKSSDPLAMYAADVNTVAVNLAGLPAISLPAGFDAGLPVGLQLIAPPFAEMRLLNAAHRFQLATDWHQRTPEGFA